MTTIIVKPVAIKLNILSILLVLAMLPILTHCSSMDNNVKIANPVWQQHVVFANSIIGWDLSGTIGGYSYDHNNTKKSFSVDIDWKYKDNKSYIYFLDLFGLVRAKCYTDFTDFSNNYIELPNGDILKEEQIDAFIYRLTGSVILNIYDLHHWVLAIPSNHAEYDLQLTKNGQILGIKQKNTNIIFNRFVATNFNKSLNDNSNNELNNKLNKYLSKNYLPKKVMLITPKTSLKKHSKIKFILNWKSIIVDATKNKPSLNVSI